MLGYGRIGKMKRQENVPKGWSQFCSVSKAFQFFSVKDSFEDDLKCFFSFFKWPTPASFCLFSFFSNTKFTEKTVGVSGIQSWIVGEEGEHADHLTTTSALCNIV